MAKKSSNRPKGSTKKSSTKKRGVKKSNNKNPVSRKNVSLNKNKGLGLYIRIKSQLWREFKSDFKGIDYRSKDSHFLSVVHKVYEECKFTGFDCTDEVITQKYKEIIGHLKRPQPFLAPELTSEPQPYWQIKDIEFELFEPYLYVKSPMILPSGGFQVSDYIDSKGDKYEGYQDYFKDWVDFCNYEFRDSTSEDYDAYFIFTKPTWNEEEGRWETEIYITTAGGSVDNFGYEPLGSTPTDMLPKNIQEIQEKTNEELKEEVKEETKKQPTQPVESETDRLLKIKASVIQEIKDWKEIGEEDLKKEAIERLRQINKKLDKLI